MNQLANHGEGTLLRNSVKVGANVSIWHFCNIMDGVIIEDNVSIGSYTEIGRASIIGKRTRIGAHVFLPTRTEIGQDCFIGPGCIMCDDRHPVAGNAAYNADPPVIEDNASIGAGAIILPGVRIGAGAMIGAGAVVTKDVAPGDTVAGVPAGLLRLPSAA